MKDTLGRENRKIPDRRCDECSKVYRPTRIDSKYCSRECKWENNGKNQGQDIDHEIWWVNSRGYIEGRVWRHGKYIRIKQTRWIMEQFLGRPLALNEIVHHINGDTLDNRIENLEVMEHGKHSSRHSKGRTNKRGYKLQLSEAERKRRSEWIREVHKQRHEKAKAKARQWYHEHKLPKLPTAS